MGFFSFGSKPTETFTEQEAFLAVALASAAANGDIDESDKKAILATVMQASIFDESSEDDLNDTFEKLMGKLEADGVGALVAIAKSSMPEDLCESAFVCAVDITLADGEIDDDEQALLEELQQVLGISDELGGKILEVMMIKNRA
jgi:tellurite resistance protein